MKDFFKKYKILSEIFSALIFAFLSILSFIEYSEVKGKKIEIIGGFAFGILAVFKVAEIIKKYWFKKKSENCIKELVK
jgi:hypothetical protein